MKEIFELQLRYLAGSAAPGAPAPTAVATGAAPPDGGVAAAASGVPEAGAAARLAQAAAAPTAVAPAGLIPHRADATEAPLTVMQERIRFTEEMYPGRNVYSISTGYRLLGNMNPALFAQALRQVIRRQGALRAYVARDASGKWVQRTLAQLDFRLPYEDLSELPPERRGAELRQQMQAIIDQPFDIHVPPLFRAALWKTGVDEHAFLLVPHHLIWDGWSFDLLADELADIYGGLVRGTVPELAPLPVDYGDFAQWHEQWLAGPQCAAQLAYWRGVFEHLPVPRPILTDRPRNAVRTAQGGVEWIRIDVERAERLRALARATGGSLSMLMTAVYAALIQQMVGGDHVVIGIAVRGRSRAELEPIMGYFSNVVPLAVRADPGQGFSAWAGTVAGLLADALDRQDVPLELLAAEPHIAAWARHAAVPFHALMSFQDTRRRKQNWGGLAQEHLVLEQHTATDDLGLWISDRPDGIEGRLVYNADIFRPRMGTLVRERFETLIGRVLERPEQPLAQLLRPSDAEEALIATWSAASGGVQVLGSDGTLLPIGVGGELWRGGQRTGQHARWSSDGVLQVLDAPAQDPALAAGAPARADGNAGLSPTEQILASVWSSVLDLPVIRPGDNFFELGGTSLEAMQMAMQLEKRLGRTVNAHQFVMGSLRSVASGYDGLSQGQGRPGAAGAPAAGNGSTGSGAVSPAVGAAAGPAVSAAASPAMSAAASGAARRRRNRQRNGNLVARLAGALFGRPALAVPAAGTGAVAPLAVTAPRRLAPAPQALAVNGNAADGDAIRPASRSNGSDAASAAVPGQKAAVAPVAARHDAHGQAAAAPYLARGGIDGALVVDELKVIAGEALRRVPHAQPPVPGAFRAPTREGGLAWYRRDDTTGRYEIL